MEPDYIVQYTCLQRGVDLDKAGFKELGFVTADAKAAEHWLTLHSDNYFYGVLCGSSILAKRLKGKTFSEEKMEEILNNLHEHKKSDL